MLTKVTEVSQIEILTTGHIQIRRRIYAVEDGVMVGEPAFHREVLDPGASTDGQPDIVKEHATVAWKPEVVTAHRQRLDVERARRMAADTK